jgi:hypothetical protein
MVSLGVCVGADAKEREETGYIISQGEDYEEG